MSDDGIENVFGSGEAEGETQPAAEEKPAPKAKAKKAPASKKADVKRTRIILAKNPDIPPTGLFIGHNGVGYKLLPGKEADVPDFLLDILDNAVVAKPVVGENGRVTGYEDSPRFPYQVVRSRK